MDYVICSKLIEEVPTNSAIAYNLLFSFLNSNSPNKVVLNEAIIDEYGTIINEIVSVWINGLVKDGLYKSVNTPDFEDGLLFIETCRQTYDKQLIVSEKEDYLEEHYCGLNIQNKYEAMSAFNTPINNITQIGVNNQITTGNNSPNQI